MLRFALGFCMRLDRGGLPRLPPEQAFLRRHQPWLGDLPPAHCAYR
jgi:hypothetical protein